MLVGRSKAMQALHRQIKSIEPLIGRSTFVLIVGETGSGKELVAQAIHKHLFAGHSARYVPVNVASIPASLADSELFGHVKGAFSGADSDRPGYIAEAAGGTLFLDEIGELPPELQPKLLRVLDNHTYHRVGSPKKVKADICAYLFATNRNLWQEVECGRFREDLYFRIARQEIHVPPLRERTDDIPLLVEYIVQNYNHPKNPKAAFSDSAWDLLRTYPWPGNVRELETVLERCIPYFLEETVDAQTLKEIYPDFTNPRVKEPNENPIDPLTMSFDAWMNKQGKDYLEAAVDQHGRDVKMVSKIIGKSERQTRRLLDKHEL